MRDRAAARSIARGTLAMRVCGECGFVFNAAFDASLLDYGAQYDNTQTWSPAFNDYVDGLVDHLIRKKDLRDANIVEVGCGKGAFLRKLLANAADNNRGYGFDPTYIGPDSDLGGRLQFRKTFFDERCVDVAADAVVCRHVIEHVEEPLVLLRAVRAAVGDSPRTQLFFETPCVDWILRNEVIWDFFYEHCSLFTVKSLTHAFARSGFAVAEVRHVFGGQYLWLEATCGRQQAESCSDAAEVVSRAEAYGAMERRSVAAWRDELKQLASTGKIALWGAGAKGVTFANLVDPDGEWIACVVDVNPTKHNRFLPGTGHPIVSPESLQEARIASALVLNSNYTTEIRWLLDQTAPHVKVFDLSQVGPVPRDAVRTKAA